MRCECANQVWSERRSNVMVFVPWPRLRRTHRNEGRPSHARRRQLSCSRLRAQVGREKGGEWRCVSLFAWAVERHGGCLPSTSCAPTPTATHGVEITLCDGAGTTLCSPLQWSSMSVEKQRRDSPRQPQNPVQPRQAATPSCFRFKCVAHTLQILDFSVDFSCSHRFSIK